MVFGGQINITATVMGTDSLTALRNQINNINWALEHQNFVSQMASAQTEKEIVTLQLSNALMREKVLNIEEMVPIMAQEVVQNENLTFSLQDRLNLEKEAIRLKEMYATESIQMSITEARVAAQANREIAQSEIEAAEAAGFAANQQRIYRRELMQSSISMFVLNISASQMIASLKPLVKGNEAATKTIDNMIASLRLALTPMQVYLAVLQIMAAAQGRVAVTAASMGLALGASLFWIYALQEKNAAIRAALFGIAAGFTVMAVASWAASMGLMTLEALTGNFGAIAVGAIGLSMLAAAIGYATTPPKAMTLSGQQKHVRRGGLAELDAGETVTRKNGGGFGDMGGEWHFHFDKATSKSDASEFGKAFAKEVTRGGSKAKSRRVVVSG